MFTSHAASGLQPWQSLIIMLTTTAKEGLVSVDECMFVCVNLVERKSVF